jgi:CRISPR associated protein Cas1
VSDKLDVTIVPGPGRDGHGHGHVGLHLAYDVDGAKRSALGASVVSRLSDNTSTSPPLLATSVGIDGLSSSAPAFFSSASRNVGGRCQNVWVSTYWEAWAPVEVPFGSRDSALVPEHGHTFGQRHSSLTRSPRLAVNAANAVLNYLYSLLEAETTLACMAIGLDPGLGIFHTDKRARDSLALDVMETCRPLVDAYLLTLLRHRTLNRENFAETGRGQCRIRASLASQLARTLPSWRTNIGPSVERVAQTLADNGPTRLDVPTSLSGADRRASWQARRPSTGSQTPSLPPLPATCRGCGSGLPSRSRRFCDRCRRASAELAGHSARAAAATALERLRADGRDPAHGGNTAQRRGSKNALHQRELAAWKSTSGGTHDPEEFTSDILPRLRERSIGELASATGLSAHYCSLIRLGKRTPHARHWKALRALSS